MMMIKQQRYYEVEISSTSFVFTKKEDAIKFFESVTPPSMFVVNWGSSDYDANPTRHFKYKSDTEPTLKAVEMELFESREESDRAYKAYELAKKMKLTKNKKSK